MWGSIVFQAHSPGRHCPWCLIRWPGTLAWHLGISGSGLIAGQYVTSLGALCPGLQHLDLRANDEPETAAMWNLQGASSIIDQATLAISASCSGLQHLDLSEVLCSEFTVEAVFSISKTTISAAGTVTDLTRQ
eukprot:gene1574-biopygen409